MARVMSQSAQEPAQSLAHAQAFTEPYRYASLLAILSLPSRGLRREWRGLLVIRVCTHVAQDKERLAIAHLIRKGREGVSLRILFSPD